MDIHIESIDILLLLAGTLGFCFSYYAIAFFSGVYSFKEENKAMIRLNQWIDAQREIKTKNIDKKAKKVSY